MWLDPQRGQFGIFVPLPFSSFPFYTTTFGGLPTFIIFQIG
jgi:hypothetical protein